MSSVVLLGVALDPPFLYKKWNGCLYPAAICQKFVYFSALSRIFSCFSLKRGRHSTRAKIDKINQVSIYLYPNKKSSMLHPSSPFWRLKSVENVIWCLELIARGACCDVWKLFWPRLRLASPSDYIGFPWSVCAKIRAIISEMLNLVQKPSSKINDAGGEKGWSCALNWPSMALENIVVLRRKLICAKKRAMLLCSWKKNVSKYSQIYLKAMFFWLFMWALWHVLYFCVVGVGFQETPARNYRVMPLSECPDCTDGMIIPILFDLLIQGGP